MKRFEVFWYDENNGPQLKELSTRQAALNFYEKHKDDKGCHGWWVTKRNRDWAVVEDIVME